MQASKILASHKHLLAASLISEARSAGKKTAVTTAVFSFGKANTPRSELITPEPMTPPQARQNLLDPLGRRLHRAQRHA